MPPGFSWRKEAIIWLIILAPVVYMLMVWDQLPEQLPSHWNLRGEVDGYSAPYTMPLLTIGIYLLLLFIPLLDPRKANYEFFQNSYYKIRLIIAAFMSGIVFLLILAGQGYDIPMDRVITTAVLALFAFMGNYLTTVKPNWFVGIRTPWTLENEEVWRRTHEMGGKLWFWGGLIGIGVCLLLPPTYVSYFMMGLISILVLIPVVYSYRLYQRLR